MLPSTTGFGSTVGHPNDDRLPSLSVTVANVLSPPSENTTSADAYRAAKPSLSAVATTSVSMTRHAPASSATRTGPDAVSDVHVPSGFANTCADSVRADRSSTGSPVSRAVTAADTASGRSVTPSPSESDAAFAGGGSAGAEGSAAAGDPASSPATSARVTTATTNDDQRRPTTSGTTCRIIRYPDGSITAANLAGRYSGTPLHLPERDQPVITRGALSRLVGTLWTKLLRERRSTPDEGQLTGERANAQTAIANAGPCRQEQ